MMNEQHFRQIVLRYKNPLIAVIYRMIHCSDTARDLAQDVFVRLWQNRDKVDSRRSVFTYLYRMAMNASIDHLRRRRLSFLPLQQIDEAGAVNSESTSELTELISRCSALLKPAQKAVFILRDIEGLDFNEISEILNTSLPNLRSNLYLARKNIRIHLKNKFQITEQDFYEL